ncbi:hypothetical protein [Methylobacterium nigriterrae]|uniref:hypothetical protein n=1 Tax=Methylobacterium nigriterrae TaxID=3127512 RepID=UPI003013CB70
MFKIAAEIHGVDSSVQRDSAREALFLAWSLRKEGAARISVSAEDGSIVSAAALAEAFQHDVGRLERRAIKQALRELDSCDRPELTAPSGRAFRLS